MPPWTPQKATGRRISKSSLVHYHKKDFRRWRGRFRKPSKAPENNGRIIGRIEFSHFGKTFGPSLATSRQTVLLNRCAFCVSQPAANFRQPYRLLWLGCDRSSI